MQIEGERLFLFIDESGDPGHPDNPSSSEYYHLNIIVSDREGLYELSRHLAAFRYFHHANKELKRYGYDKQIQQIKNILKDTKATDHVSLYAFCVNKGSYIGPYLKRIKREVSDYDPKKFRNFIVRMSLESLFHNDATLTTASEIELIFDRYLENEDDQANLTQYLRNNYRLPNFFHVLQVDSDYSEPVQAADYLGRLVKDFCVDKKGDLEDLLEFVYLFELDNPDSIKRKTPGHS
jgi:hypothetical protein